MNLSSIPLQVSRIPITHHMFCVDLLQMKSENWTCVIVYVVAEGRDANERETLPLSILSMFKEGGRDTQHVWSLMHPHTERVPH